MISDCKGMTEHKKIDRVDKTVNCCDALTGLYNSTFFKRQMELLDNQRQLPLSVIICNINGVKLINDILGEAKGNTLLVKTAKLVSACVRGKGIIARISEDEFYILLPQTSSRIAQSVVDSIRIACRKYKKEFCKDSLSVGISMGSATKTHMVENFSDILITAEKKMRRQKLLEYNDFHNSLIESIRWALFEKSHETKEHADRLVGESRILGKALGLTQEQLNELKVLASLHDIGKISIDKGILTKPGPLNEEEWREIKKHPLTGYRIALAFPQLSSIAKTILYHHERWDGKGYPHHLRGENIPLLSRIIAVVDTFDALTSKRCYRRPVSINEALDEIERNAGTQFDPAIAKVFIKIKRGGQQ